MSSENKKIILVTGGAGFIGSYLCEELVKSGHKIISLDNYFTGKKENHIEGVDYREGHTKDIDKHVSEKPDIIYHLGEYSRVEQSFNDVPTVWDFNIVGTFAVLEFARKHNSKIIYAGSSTKFGDNGLGRYQSPYAWTKASNTDLVVNYGDWFNVPYAITYFYNVYGPREISTGSYATVIGIFSEKFKNGEPLSVVLPGTQVRNFTHVKDIVRGLVLVGEKGEGDEYGLGDERSYSILEIAQMFGSEIKMLPERKGNRMGAALNISKSKLLGWKTEEDIKEYIQSIKNNKA
ncbi:MAG: NAD-dependent epimerase/dehydratase family protein [Candidatus Paceibacterota bacterium]|jgi:UDP-glucose 4-epimerase